MKMYEKLQRAHGTLMTVNDRSDFDLEPTCKLLKQAADHIETTTFTTNELELIREVLARHTIRLSPTGTQYKKWGPIYAKIDRIRKYDNAQNN